MVVNPEKTTIGHINVKADPINRVNKHKKAQERSETVLDLLVVFLMDGPVHVYYLMFKTASSC